jgi:hypothetical protein
MDSGIFPIAVMIWRRTCRQRRVSTPPLHSLCSREDVIYEAELPKTAGQPDGLEVFHTLARRRADHWERYSRRISRDVLADVRFCVRQLITAWCVDQLLCCRG